MTVSSESNVSDSSEAMKLRPPSMGVLRASFSCSHDGSQAGISILLGGKHGKKNSKAIMSVGAAARSTKRSHALSGSSPTM